jgi:hypothetical protein
MSETKKGLAGLPARAWFDSEDQRCSRRLGQASLDAATS